MRSVIMLMALAALLAACAAGGEPDAGEGADAEGLTIELVTPATGDGSTGDGYPPSLAPTPATGSGYPAAPESAGQPTGYPELTVVAPSGEVDLGNLTPVTPDTTTPQVMPSPGRPGVTPPSTMLEAIVRDLGAQSDVPVDEITFVSAMPMTWPNGGLGCPAEGMAYIEVPVEGTLITMQAGGRDYTYHTDGDRNFALCVNGERVSSGVVPRR